MVLSTEPRGSYADVLGGAMTMDAYNPVGDGPRPIELFRCFREALRISGVDAAEWPI